MRSDDLQRERARLAKEQSRNADDEQRSAAYALQVSAALAAFGLGPLVPKAELLLGALTPAVALAAVTPGILSRWVCRHLYHRWGPDDRRMPWVDAAEVFVCSASFLVFIHQSGLAFSVLWILSPFTATFFAATKPFHARVYLPVFAVSHALLAGIFLGQRHTLDAAIALFTGVLSMGAYLVVARQGQRQAAQLAARNLLRREWNEGRLDAERRRITASLTASVGRELKTLKSELVAYAQVPEAEGLLAQAKATLASLEELRSEATTPAATTFAAFSAALEVRCQALCQSMSWVFEARGSADARIGADTASALFHVGLELMRNAVAHASAERVVMTLERLEDATLRLAVEDDGVGLSPERFASSQGGLAHARDWLDPLSATVALSVGANARGSRLEVRVPLAAG